MGHLCHNCANNILIVQPKKKTPLEKYRRRSEDNIKLDLTHSVRMWTETGSGRSSSNSRSCRQVNEYSGSIKGRKLDQLSKYQLSKKDFAPWG
jgi:hypothetical protein